MVDILLSIFAHPMYVFPRSVCIWELLGIVTNYGCMNLKDLYGRVQTSDDGACIYVNKDSYICCNSICEKDNLNPFSFFSFSYQSDFEVLFHGFHCRWPDQDSLLPPHSDVTTYILCKHTYFFCFCVSLWGNNVGFEMERIRSRVSFMGI